MGTKIYDYVPDHKILSPEADVLRRRILKDLIAFGELTGRPDQVPEWRWFDKMCYQHDAAIIMRAVAKK